MPEVFSFQAEKNKDKREGAYMKLMKKLTAVLLSVFLAVPMFGIIAQNTSSRWGRYRPYILFGAPVLAVFNCLTFFKPEASVGVKAMWCALTYIGCDLAYTAITISTGSIVNSMTSIVKELSPSSTGSSTSLNGTARFPLITMPFPVLEKEAVVSYGIFSPFLL